MGLFDDLVESRIREASERGEFDGLPGAGRPLDLDDDALVPEELRAAYRLLKNAGCLPPELEALREIDALLERIVDAELSGSREAADPRGTRRLLALTLELEAAGFGRSARGLIDYRERVRVKLAARHNASISRGPPHEP